MADWFIDHMDHDFNVIQTFEPETLNFKKVIRGVGDATYEISGSAKDVDGATIITGDDFIGPYRTYFHIRRNATILWGGVHTSVKMTKGSDFMQVGGKDWLHTLDRRQVPFDPRVTPYFGTDHVRDFIFGPGIDAYHPAPGFTYEQPGRDVGLIAKDILTVILARPWSIPISLSSIGSLGFTINFSLALGDTSTALSILDGLSEYYPGFDYWVTPSRIMEFATPYRFGVTTEALNPASSQWVYTFDDSDPEHTPAEVTFGNTGPQATHLIGRGAGTGSTSLMYALGDKDVTTPGNQKTFGRLDGAEDFGDKVKTMPVLINRTNEEFIFGLNPVHEITVTVYPESVPDFWTIFDVGLAFWLDQQLIAHRIQSAQRIVSMDCTVDNERNESVDFGLNQIYDVASDYGAPEG